VIAFFKNKHPNSEIVVSKKKISRKKAEAGKEEQWVAGR